MVLIGKKAVTTKPDGSKDYFVDGKKVSKSEFNKALTPSQARKKRREEEIKRQEESAAEREKKKIEKAVKRGKLELTESQLEVVRQGQAVFERGKIVGFELVRRKEAEAAPIVEREVREPSIAVLDIERGITRLPTRAEEFSLALQRPVSVLPSKDRITIEQIAKETPIGTPEKVFFEIDPFTGKSRPILRIKEVVAKPELPSKVIKGKIEAAKPISEIKGRTLAAGRAFLTGAQLRPLEEGLLAARPERTLAFLAGTVGSIASLGIGKVIGAGVKAIPVVRTVAQRAAGVLTSEIVAVPLIALAGRELIISAKEGHQEFARTGALLIRDISFFGGVIGRTGIRELSPILQRPISVGAKRAVLRPLTKDIPAEQIFAPEALAGDVTLVKAKGVSEIVKTFEAAKVPKTEMIEVVTAAPKPISGVVAGVGKKAGLGLEDPGIFVAPVGRGQPFFLRVGKPSVVTRVEVPETIGAGLFDLPTATIFTAKGISLQPRSVVREPGFESTAKFFRSIADVQPGRVFVTKRAEIGQQALQRQLFARKELSFEQGELVFGKPKGLVQEFGTTELEAVIPVGQQFTRVKPKGLIGRLFGFEETTLVEGQVVAIRRAKLKTVDDLIGVKDVPISDGVDVLGGVSEAALTGRVISVTELSGAGGVSILGFRPGKVSDISSLVISGKSRLVSERLNGKVIGVSEVSDPSRTFRGIDVKRFFPVQKVRRDVGVQREIIKPSEFVSGVSIVSEVFKPSFVSEVGRGESRLVRRFMPSEAPSVIPGIRLGKPKKGVELFDVAIGKSENVFFRQIRDLPFEKAISFGRKGVERTAAASFRIVKAGGEEIGEELKKRISFGLGGRFRTAKLDTGRFVQKRQFRIKSLGELDDITKKGLRAIRGKSKLF